MFEHNRVVYNLRVMLLLVMVVVAMIALRVAIMIVVGVMLSVDDFVSWAIDSFGPMPEISFLVMVKDFSNVGLTCQDLECLK